MATSNPLPSQLVEVDGYKFWNVNGRLWPHVHGGAVDVDPPADPPVDDPADPPADPPKGDDDGVDWKAESRKHERAAKAARKEADALRVANQTEAEKALELAREEAAKATRDELTPELTKARLELAVLRSAGTKLADPGDALRFIDPADVTNDDGTVDPKRLSTEIDALIESKPYLAAGAQRVPKVPGGPRNPGAPEPGPGKSRLTAAFAEAGQ